jgi:hypothetical protein
MAVRKMRVSFDIDMPVFLAVLAQSNSNMRIDLFGDDKPTKVARLNGHKPLLLEGPRRGGKRVTAYSALLRFLADNKDKGFRASELKPAVTAVGLSDKSVSPQLGKLRTDGFVKRSGGAKDGTYQITHRGVTEHTKRAEAAAQAGA